MPSFTARTTGTDTGAAVDEALSLVAERRAVLRDRGTYVHRPTIVLMTDGQNNQDSRPYSPEELAARIAAEKVVFAPVAIGDDADYDYLRRLAGPGVEVLSINSSQSDSISFEQLFKAVRNSFVTGESIATEALKSGGDSADETLKMLD